MSLSKRQAVIVLGAHRSGTSALAGTLSLLGVRLPARMMSPGPGNPKGHFEPRHIVAIHDRVLAAAGTTWSGWDEVPTEWQQSETCQPFVEELAAALSDDYGPTGVFVVKDPRMCRLVPLWLRVLERVGVEASFAIPFRNPVEVARSLMSRSELSLPHGCLTWLRGVLDAERQTRGYPRAFLHYDELVDDPRAVLERLVAALPVSWPRRPGEVGGELQQFIDPALRNHLADASAIGEMGDYSPWLRQAFGFHEFLASGGDEAAVRSGFDGLRMTFNTADAAFTPAIKHAIETHRGEVARLQTLAQQQRDALAERNAVVAALDRRVSEGDAALDAAHARLREFEVRAVAATDEASALRSRSAAMAREIAELRSSTSWRITAPLRSARRLLAREGRSGEADSSPAETASRPREMMDHLMAPAGAPFEDEDYVITNFMHYIWQLRSDVNAVFDLANKRSRLEFCRWFLMDASREHALPPEAYPDQLLAKLIAGGGAVAEKAAAVRGEKQRRANAPSAVAPAESSSAAEPEARGANIAGYLRGEFGMGEFSRTIVRSFDAVGLPFSAIDFPEATIHGMKDASVEHLIGGTQRFKTNIVNINPDLLPPAYFKLGESFFTNRFNIGYWAWELSKCPPAFDIALGMVDEVWALSDFTADCFRLRSPVPVFSMPLAVSVPALARQFTKRDFGLAEDSFAFLFTFDAASYLGRKNPVAAVLAFKQAFPRGTERVRLVLKTMNVPAAAPLWDTLVAEAQSDPRIQIVNQRVSREEIVGLTSVCDAVVSLHRSEGFGLTVAEAMLLGKPAVVTDYSGTRTFAREDTACVVDFTLVPVPAGQYPFWQDQMWAEPDVAHAASLMRRLVDDEPYRQHIARAGQSFVAKNFNEEVAGARYAARLDQLRKRGFASGRAGRAHQRRSAGDANDVVTGSIEQPDPGTLIPSSTAVEVVGWFASHAGIESLEVYCDARYVGQAAHGVLRPDVARVHPHFKDAAHAGFFRVIDSEALAAGPHQLRVVARSRSGREAELTRQFRLGGPTAYAQWLKNNAPARADEDAQAARAIDGTASPRITLLLVSEQSPDQPGIAATLRSISAQTYRKFDVLVFAPRGAPWNVDAIAQVEEIADRIRVVEGDSGLWTEALAQARGDFIAVVEAGDVLDPRALLAVAENVAKVPTIDFLYADEDRIGRDGRGRPRFKPSYSPIFLESHDYIGRPWFARRALVTSAVEGGATNQPRSEHVLIKRVGDAARAIAHVPMVLLSRPDWRENVDGRAALPLASGLAADEPWPRISIVIPTCLKAPDVVAKCLSALAERTDYPDLEIIVVVNNVSDVQAAREFLGRWPGKVLTWDHPYTWSGINNFAARRAGGDHLLFLNDDIEPLSPGWLKQMVRLSRRDAVGAVGALLRYPNGMIQHGGITVSDRTELGRHLFRHRAGREPAAAEIAGYTRECRAVTGACLLTRRDCFEALGGFDEDMRLVANDIDYCLRLGERGYAIVIAAQAVLTHHEGLSRGGAPEKKDIERFWGRWRGRLSTDDPFTNPNLDVQRDDWSVDPEAHAARAARVRPGPGARLAAAAASDAVPSVVPAGWPIAPPFEFNSPTMSQFAPEVTGRTLLRDMCTRLGWSSLAGKRLLDYGCGVQLVRTIVNLEMEIGEYAGVDLNGDAIAWLRANVRDERFRFEQLDMRNPMYNPAGAPVAGDALTVLGLSSYDAACMLSVITHQEPADAATIFAMLHPCAPRLYFTAFVDDAIDGHEDRDPSCRCGYSVYSTALLTSLLAQTGWRIEAIFPPGRFQQAAFLCARDEDHR